MKFVNLDFTKDKTLLAWDEVINAWHKRGFVNLDIKKGHSSFGFGNHCQMEMFEKNSSSIVMKRISPENRRRQTNILSLWMTPGIRNHIHHSYLTLLSHISLFSLGLIKISCFPSQRASLLESPSRKILFFISLNLMHLALQ